MARFNTNEWLTFLNGFGSLVVGVGSLVVSYMTYQNATDTSDIKTAISNLSDLATQTKRQADAMNEQLGAVRDQVSALRDLAQEAKHQTAAIADQTEAIIRSSEANISSAQAQRTMAEVTAQAQKPDVVLKELTISGLNGEPDRNGYIHPTLMWRFDDTGGAALTVKTVIFGFTTGDALPQKMPEGTHVDGAGQVITNSITSGFHPTSPYPFDITKDTRDALNRGDTKLFFFAKFEYWDNLNNEHFRCFGREFILKDGGSDFAIPSGGEAYQCYH